MNSRKANFSDDDILALLENSDDDDSTDSKEPCMQGAKIDSSLFSDFHELDLMSDLDTSATMSIDNDVGSSDSTQART